MVLTLAECKATVNAHIEQQVLGYVDEAMQLDPYFASLVITINRYLAQGGKRMRAYLAYLSYVGLGGTDLKEVWPLSTSLELLHAFLLIHDDIIDGDLLRHGSPNVHGVYQDRLAVHRHITDPAKQSERIALLAGDTTHLLSNRAILESSLSSDQKVQLLELINEVILGTVGGELLEFAVSLKLPEVPAETTRINQIYIYKTAIYTVYLPLITGMRLAGSKVPDELIRQVAIPLGIAFQIQDDIIGIFGDPTTTGKPTDSDIREGKRTLLYTKTLELLDPLSQARFERVFGNPNLRSEDATWAREVIRSSGALDQVRQTTEAHVETALAKIPFLRMSEDVSAVFTALAKNLVKRVN